MKLIKEPYKIVLVYSWLAMSFFLVSGAIWKWGDFTLVHPRWSIAGFGVCFILFLTASIFKDRIDYFKVFKSHKGKCFISILVMVVSAGLWLIERLTGYLIVNLMLTVVVFIVGLLFLILAFVVEWERKKLIKNSPVK